MKKLLFLALVFASAFCGCSNDAITADEVEKSFIEDYKFASVGVSPYGSTVVVNSVRAYPATREGFWNVSWRVKSSYSATYEKDTDMRKVVSARRNKKGRVCVSIVGDE